MIRAREKKWKKLTNEKKRKEKNWANGEEINEMNGIHDYIINAIYHCLIENY